MNGALDSSILIAALVSTLDSHQECSLLLDQGDWLINTHALVETFNTLTGGRRGLRLPADQASDLIQSEIMPYVSPLSLPAEDVLAAFLESRLRGVRGGAIFDYLHLVAARKAGAARLYTLNMSDFLAFHRPGDPEILHP